MAQFAVGQSITTREPTIEVDAGLAAGDHRYSLVVLDAAGRRSAADVVTVRVQRLVIPGPIDRPDPTPVPIDRLNPTPTPTPTPIGRLDPTPTPGRLGGVVRPPAAGSPAPAKRPAKTATPAKRATRTPKRKRSDPK
jgi:hypothetical protein